jgi:GalNAc-alpha-(1->4)-GalNAc-alpha-(1->3)-diNAcBac-PP-undecaprenol alpha-1,4-N-acetyl-D-galactosaminyltransferase
LSRPGWKLLIAGYDHLKQQNLENLKKLTESLGISNSVQFLGKVENVDEVYAASSIFAFTSSSEGFPNVVGEAMSASLPVVAYDCVAGPSEMIKDGYNGYLVPLFADDVFESRLANLMDDGELRLKLGHNARESIKRFSEREICLAFYNFILRTAGTTDQDRSDN